MLSAREQSDVQAMIDSASLEEKARLKSQAEAVLLQTNRLMGQKFLTAEENNATYVAVEILTRLDATEHGKGWWYRAKRRAQIVQMYLGS